MFSILENAYGHHFQEIEVNLVHRGSQSGQMKRRGSWFREGTGQLDCMMRLTKSVAGENFVALRALSEIGDWRIAVGRWKGDLQRSGEGPAYRTTGRDAQTAVAQLE